MAETDAGDLHDALAAFGSDLSRWPDALSPAARAALLSKPRFRQAWEEERELDREMLTLRDELDRSIRAGGGIDRVRRAALAGLPVQVPASLVWSRVAAGVLVAAMLGGVMNYVLAEDAAATSEIAAVDPLYADQTAVR